jgi:hypothetical protein
VRHLQAVCGISMALLCAGAPSAQGTSAKSAPPKELSKEELEARLAEVKGEILDKMLTEKMRKEPDLARQWLGKFQTVQSTHYLLFTNGPQNTCKKFAASLEKLYQFVKREFPFDDADHKLECFVFKTKEDYVRFCVALVGWSEEQANKTAGHANATYYATYYQSPTADTVMHEATHQIVGACLRISGVGSWFQEGMAVYIERKIGNTDPSAGMKNDLRSGNYVPLAKFCGLESLLFGAKAGEEGRSYQHSGALIDFLANTKLAPVAGRFGDFLAGAQECGRSLAATEALVKTVYGLTLPELEELWKKHTGAK